MAWKDLPLGRGHQRLSLSVIGSPAWATPGSLLNGLQGLPKLAVSYIFKGLDSISPVESKDERIPMLKRVEFYSVVEAGALGCSQDFPCCSSPYWYIPTVEPSSAIPFGKVH